MVTRSLDRARGALDAVVLAGVHGGMVVCGRLVRDLDRLRLRLEVLVQRERMRRARRRARAALRRPRPLASAMRTPWLTPDDTTFVHVQMPCVPAHDLDAFMVLARTGTAPIGARREAAS